MATMLDGLFVKLSFNVDKESQAKFNEQVNATEKGVSLAAKRMGLMVAAAEAAIATVKRLVNNLKGLEAGYMTATKFGGDAGNLKALERTFEKFGGSAQEARGAVESLYHKLQEAPGLADSIEQQLGVEIIDKTTGQYKDLSLVIPQIGEKLSHMDRATANAYASMMGLSGVMDEITRGGFAETMGAQTEAIRAMGTEYQNAGKDAHSFLNQVKDMLATVADVTLSGFYDLMKGYFGANWVRDLTDWLASGIRAVFAGVKGGTDAASQVSWANPIKKAEAFYNGMTSAASETFNSSQERLKEARKIQDRASDMSDKLTEAQQPSQSTINGVKSPFSQAQGARIDAAMNHLLERGLTVEQASGVLGVFYAESNLDPTAKAKAKNDTGRGIAQWTKNASGDRIANFWKIYGRLFGDAEQYGGDITKVPLERQLDVFLAERPTITQAIKGMHSAADVSGLMLRGYENGGGTINSLASPEQLDAIYGKWGNGYNRMLSTRVGFAEAIQERWNSARMAARSGAAGAAAESGKVNSDNRVNVVQNFNFGHQAGTPEAIGQAAEAATIQTNNLIFSPVGG